MFLIRYVVIIFKKTKNKFCCVTINHKKSLSKPFIHIHIILNPRYFWAKSSLKMKKPKQIAQEDIQELKEEPYKYFEGVDYKRIMALNISSIRIDAKNEQKGATNQ